MGMEPAADECAWAPPCSSSTVCRGRRSQTGQTADSQLQPVEAEASIHHPSFSSSSAGSYTREEDQIPGLSCVIPTAEYQPEPHTGLLNTNQHPSDCSTMAFSPWQMLSPVQWAKWTWSAVRGAGGEEGTEDEDEHCHESG